ncbi:MAG: DUF3800 domain-containing protein [Chloroflexota bacterium]
MKTPAEGANWFFVDESGDPTFYDRHGNLSVVQEGCSPVLLLGFIETTDPAPIRRALAELHAEIANDEYLRGIPSISKTRVAFHAKDDVAEVRQAVFKCLRGLDFKAQFVVARKIERVFRNAFHGSEEKFYDRLVAQLFQRVLHRYTDNRVYFAKRGSRNRQQPLQAAINAGIARFEEEQETKVTTQVTVSAQTPIGEPCLQVIDYLNWAVYRAFVKQEMRYFEFMRDKVSLLVDLYDVKNYPNNWYNRNNPFELNKISPL